VQRELDVAGVVFDQQDVRALVNHDLEAPVVK
jgi:hypothetical protein